MSITIKSVVRYTAEWLRSGNLSVKDIVKAAGMTGEVVDVSRVGGFEAVVVQWKGRPRQQLVNGALLEVVLLGGDA